MGSALNLVTQQEGCTFATYQIPLPLLMWQTKRWCYYGLNYLPIEEIFECRSVSGKKRNNKIYWLQIDVASEKWIGNYELWW